MDEDLIKGGEELVNTADLWGKSGRLAPGHEVSICTQMNDIVSRPAGQTATSCTVVSESMQTPLLFCTLCDVDLIFKFCPSICTQ